MSEELAVAPEATTTEPQVAPEPVAEPTAPPSVPVPQGQAPSEPAGQTFTVKVGGEDVSVSLDEALNGYMRQADYTRKTQEVAQQREELTHAQRIAQALEEDPQRAIEALVTAYEVPFVLQPQQQAPQAPAVELSPEEAWQQRVDSFITSQETRAFEAQVRADLATMHTQFGEFDDTEVIKYAVEHQIPSITEATKAFVVDKVLSAAQRQVSERQAQQAKASAPPVAGGHGVAGGTVQTGGTTKVNSIEAALDEAAASLGFTF